MTTPKDCGCDAEFECKKHSEESMAEARRTYFPPVDRMTQWEADEEEREEKCMSLDKVLSFGRGSHHPQCPFFGEPLEDS